MKNAARLMIASSELSADLYWATRFYVPDPIIYLEHRGQKILVAPDLEFNRAKREAEVDLVIPISSFEKRLKKPGKPLKAGDVLDAVLRSLGIKSLQVPSYFPFEHAEELKKRGYRVQVVPDPFYPGREIKTARERKLITEALRITESGIQAAIDVLKKSKIKRGMIYRNGAPVTSEDLRRVIEMRMMESGALGQHTIVSCGKQAADPHCRGSGPLYANQTIVLDVFPKSMKTGYHGDITRTVVKGRASETLKKMYAAVRAAQETGIKHIRHGVDASLVHAEVCRTLDRMGFKTDVQNGRPQGFIHSTGHGLGLDVHEAPRVSRLKNRLKAGHVVTVEPGLYYEKWGGIRIEDVVYVTKSGCKVLTKIPKVFEIP
jgi:Xaa-Pro aminopeptidase